ncbi:bifunctional folylpolyglutamate synthase/dihydrofolate synthase [Sediminibacterium soli]|uniref:bifunctional folylpolyglutamate synthase/dihydrofolate synthase n=1 Tax=Sediminibacterium soli TaxID=2698829 RepID=UPI00137B4E84|nr:folylpolyglutamate synthase/dihydrofolate synthase family protein [Sediminibacterium soli]NCI46034.1 bifunctional folylpolyglutamate synthase/dihydrofolate synthase [Sediminibacterium soli]
MDYPQTLDYLFTRLPMFSRVGADAFKKDLTNTLRLCEALGNPHTRFRSVHIAGTNGKGSSSHMLAAVLQAAGYKTGLYTSPHLKDFRERIKVNGDMCEPGFVIDFTQRMQTLIEEISPSFFEITVAMAFDYFAQQGVDIAVIEVGLGGRFDSTNIITPELSLITNIGWDHMNILGDTLEKIAFEKAGIIKPGITAVVSEVVPETKGVFRNKALSVNAPLVFAEEKKYIADWRNEQHLLQVEIADKTQDTHEHISLDLTGIYQLKNIVGVLEVLRQLRLKGWQITDEQLKHGLSHVKKLTGLHGRWEVIRQHPMAVLDVGHNTDGIKQLIRQLEFCDYTYLHIVTGMAKDKDIDAALALLPKYATYYFTQAQIPRALDAASLQRHAAAHGLHGDVYPTVNAAYQEALARAHKEDLILICGSVFLVGELNY